MRAIETIFLVNQFCNFTINAYYHVHFVTFILQSYSCGNSSPGEFCTEKNDVIYFSMENANVYTNANIRIEVESYEKDRKLSYRCHVYDDNLMGNIRELSKRVRVHW